MCQALWQQVQPRRYHYSILPQALVQAFLMAFVARLSGLRAVGERCGHLLRTEAFNSISDALRRRSSLGFARALLGMLETTHTPGVGELVALDGMALTLPQTQRHHCKKFNDKTVGGGVIWAYMIHAARGASPVKILSLVDGAWCDSKVMRGIPLAPRGPVYVMDRGFYALELLAQWLGQEVRFIIRARERSLYYQVERPLGAPRRIGAKQLELDAIVRLGGPQAKAHPRVRLIVARLSSGEKLTLATDRLAWSAERVLDGYRKRWHIERFHRYLKDVLGLAHLYSFDRAGMNFLLCTALLAALLLFFAQNDPSGETIALLGRVLAALRDRLGLGTIWRRNSCIRPRGKKKPAKKKTQTAER